MGKLWLTYVAVILVFNRVKIVQLAIGEVKDVGFEVFSELTKKGRFGCSRRFMRNLKVLMIAGGSKRL